MGELLSDNQIITKVVDTLKEKGIFDKIRRDCLEDINTKSSFLNLNQRIEGYVKNFLNDQEWHSGLSKNQLRERLRKDINESGLIKSGVSHLVEQVINPTNFENKIEEQICEILGIEDVKDKYNDNLRKKNEIKIVQRNDEEIYKEDSKNKEIDKVKFDDKLDDISDEEDDDLFLKNSDEEKLNDSNNDELTYNSNKNSSNKSYNEDKSEKTNLFKNNNKNEINIKTEKYEESISSTDDLDCID